MKTSAIFILFIVLFFSIHQGAFSQNTNDTRWSWECENCPPEQTETGTNQRRIAPTSNNETYTTPEAMAVEKGNTLGYPLLSINCHGYFVVLMSKCDWIGEKRSGVRNLPPEYLRLQKIYTFKGEVCENGKPTEFIALRFDSLHSAELAVQALKQNGNNAYLNDRLRFRDYKIISSPNGK